MQIFESIQEWKSYRSSVLQSKKIGFIPTMGAIHKGHLSLAKKSINENEITVVSIFVNPTQFNNKKDLRQYPKDNNKDKILLKNIGVDIIIFPKTDEIYANEYRFMLSENSLSRLMEGQHRPGHFNGVLTVVMKLINIVNPNIAYFGEKDYQQFLLIRDMTFSFFIDTKIVVCPTIREDDGLALSSRNRFLSNQDRKIAPFFYKILLSGKSIDKIKKNLIHHGFEIDYIENYNNRCYGAVQLNDVRLIDNVKL